MHLWAAAAVVAVGVVVVVLHCKIYQTMFVAADLVGSVVAMTHVRVGMPENRWRAIQKQHQELEFLLHF